MEEEVTDDTAPMDYAKIAELVAQLIHPTIIKNEEQALQQSVQDTKKKN